MVASLLTCVPIYAEPWSLSIVDSSQKPVAHVEVQIYKGTESLQKFYSNSQGKVILSHIPKGNYTFVLFKRGFGYSRYQLQTTCLPAILTLYTFEESAGNPVSLKVEKNTKSEETLTCGNIEPTLFHIIELKNSFEWVQWLKTSEVHSTQSMSTIYRDYFSTTLEITWTFSYDIKARYESEGWQWKIVGSTSLSYDYTQTTGHEITASEGEDMTIYQQFTLRYEHWVHYIVLIGGTILKVDEWEKVFVKDFYPASFMPLIDNPPGDDDLNYMNLGWLGTQNAINHGFTTIIENTVSTSLSVSFSTEFSSDLFGATSLGLSGMITLGRTIRYECIFQQGHAWELYTRNRFIIFLYKHNPPNTPSTPSGPTSGYRYIWYTYSSTTTDPDGDYIRYEFEFSGPIPTISFTTGWYASGQTGSITVMWEPSDPPGTYYIRARAQDSLGAWSGWSPCLVVNIKSGYVGGCPMLYVNNGSGYVYEGLLNIHNIDGIDVIFTHTLLSKPARVRGTHQLKLVEHPQTWSHVDQVKLYALLEDGTIKEMPLISAWHSEYGNVLPKLLFSDERKTEIKGANHNNGISQNIHLKFLALPPNKRATTYIFKIEGNNLYYKE